MLILQVFVVYKNIIFPMFVLNLKYVVENMEFLCSVSCTAAKKIFCTHLTFNR